MINQVRILLVEDDRVDQLTFKSLLDPDVAARLSIPNPVVTFTETLKQAEAELRVNEFEVVVLDLNLPDSSDLTAISRIHAIFPDQATIVLSGIWDKALMIEAVQAGAQDYLVKGLPDSERLFQAIAMAIAKAERDKRRRVLLKNE